MKKYGILLNLLFLLSSALLANIIKVPDDQPNMQSAIDKASDGDTILVSPGLYYENLNLYTKSIVLTSHYLFDNDTSYISKTIINGSRPNHPDTASCILIIGGQDSTTIIQGFTITGGKGTAWKDEHSGGTYREGGGILVALSSPTIRHNLIINNEAVDYKGLTGTGGGGIRCGDGSPKILNNVIINNTGRYGAGIVLNWCGAIIRNNIIAGNKGGEDYGGGGLWINNTNGNINIIENNTIVNNHSFASGGGILMYNNDSRASLRNNIIYGNTAASSSQLTIGANVTLNNCNITGNWNGEGNIAGLPQFTDSLFYLQNTSINIDAGDTAKFYNDLNDTLITDHALFPSLGKPRNDIGAYGGPGAAIFPYFQFSGIGLMLKSVSFSNSNVIGQTVKQKITVVNQSTGTKMIDSAVVMLHKDQLKLTYVSTNELQPSQGDSILIEWTPKENIQFSDTILIYHNALNSANPLKVLVLGKVKQTTGVMDLESKSLIYNFPNPFQTITEIYYYFDEKSPAASLTVYDIQGKALKSFYGLENSGVLEFDGGKLPEGIYIYNLTVSDDIEVVRKMLIRR